MDFSSPEAALANISGRIPADAALQALADLRITTREGRYPMKLAVLLKSPASLRAEAIPLFGPPSFFLSIHARTLKIYLAESRAFYTGRATPDNIARYLPLRMDPEDLIAVLTGTAPRIREQQKFLQGRPEGDHYRIDMGGPSQHRSLWVRVADGFLERIEFAQDQRMVYRVSFEAPLEVEGTMLPQQITIDSGSEDGLSISIRYADIRFLQQTDPALFDIKAPPGIEPVYLD